MMEHDCIVIGIGGVTCGGKTTIAKELQTKIPRSALIHQDDYFYPVGSPNLEYIDEIRHYYWDALSAIDTEKFISDVESIIQNVAVNQNRIIIIEGNLIFNVTRVAGLCIKKYFLTVSKENARFRRRTRKYKRYDVKYFDEYAWPSYEFHKKKAFDMYKDLIILNGDLEASVNVNAILNDLQLPL